ncbi:ABC transporter substrate-binding protein [Rhodonellum sp.]|uniref:ABC transporter substrate-binding protein n=1 Tax=Rhodonellum sp. TaxID=2231180 RepID=UPI002721038C|nr:ABC transporter substrate-binding protein [Rhodonellum sp.]MDO9552097.1 ABC transporter substrate-binding protein [Rhodonellum sp.]
MSIRNILSSVHFLLYFILMAGLFFSCQTNKEGVGFGLSETEIFYAKGFKITQGDDFSILEVSQAFPGDHLPFRYLVLDNLDAEKPEGDFDAIITLPIQKLIVTSTTHIPHLDFLNASDRLIGFPDLDLISSEQTRRLIDGGKIQDIGSGAKSNIEMMIDLEPDWVMISTLGEDLKNLELLKAAGIPVVINGEYVEQHPLGRAEWIKFTGVLLGKFDEASAIFSQIEKDYLEAIATTKDIEKNEKPSVMAGVMYKDVWYVPGNDSWGAQLLQAAGGNYVFEAQKGSGSIQLSYEYVLDLAQESEFWLGASDFKSLEAMASADNRYIHFESFQKGNIYSYTSKKGPTGGIEYFELGYMRPDLILKDLIKILHPELLPEYSLYFYSRLDER